MQLYTSSNYHWYLKQSLEFSGVRTERVASVLWDTEHEYVLHVMCGGGQYLRYRWSWTIHSSSDNHTSVGVIDGGEE